MTAIDLVYNTTNLSNMGNFTALSGGLSSVTKGDAIAEAAQLSKEVSDFQNLLDSITRELKLKKAQSQAPVSMAIICQVFPQQQILPTQGQNPKARQQILQILIFHLIVQGPSIKAQPSMKNL